MTPRHARARDTTRTFVLLCSVLAVVILVFLLLWLLRIMVEISAFVVIVGLLAAIAIVIATFTRRKP